MLEDELVEISPGDSFSSVLQFPPPTFPAAGPDVLPSSATEVFSTDPELVWIINCLLIKAKIVVGSELDRDKW